MRIPTLAQGEIYHVFNRAVDGRSAFSDDNDRKRFINSLIQFNTTESLENSISKSFFNIKIDQKRLVNILAFCLMPNHFHLLLEQTDTDGISKFMHKIGSGYTKYFNHKTKRRGALFETSYKAKLIDKEAYLLQIIKYIHLNPMDLMGSKNKSKKRFLCLYQWSSLRAYIGKESMPFVDLSFMDMFKNTKDYMNFLLSDNDNSSTGAKHR